MQGVERGIDKKGDEGCAESEAAEGGINGRVEEEGRRGRRGTWRAGERAKVGEVELK